MDSAPTPMAASFKKKMATAHTGMIRAAVMQMITVKVISLSASGSRMRPRRVTWLKWRAIQPSAMSVKKARA